MAPRPVSPAVAATACPDTAPESWEAVYQAHARFIYYLALRYLGDPTQAEDATHDVFLKAIRKRDQFRGEANLRTWLYRITINHCQNLLRSWARRHLAPEPIEESRSNLPGPAETPLRILEVKELGERIQKTLDAIGPEYRLLLLLAADERLSYEEIAALTEQTVDAVRGKIHRARKAFTLHFPRTQ